VSGRARLITFEGIDGSGKSTQARLLFERLRANGGDPVLTREPGGSLGAEVIRKILVEGEPDRWSPETEILLFTAARRDHLERTITPALTDGRDVISDRFVDSTRVYQGAVRSDLRGLVDELHERLIRREPDITLILDVDPVAAMARGTGHQLAEGRFESFGASFQSSLRRGFLDLAAAFPNRCRVVDANQAADDVEAEIAGIVPA
jgi:dTMP kinase